MPHGVDSKMIELSTLANSQLRLIEAYHRANIKVENPAISV